MKKNRTILEILLSLLKVKYTKEFVDKLYNEHPHKYNLFGLSSMLSDYGVENIGLRVDNKGNYNLSEIEAPFIAHFGGDFVIVYKISSKKIIYIWNEERIETSIAEFKKDWSGIILLMETNNNSIEPQYNENRKKEFFNHILIYFLFLIIAVSSLFTIIINRTYSDFGMVLSLLVNIGGLYISYLLILKQLNIQSNKADKLCSLFKESDCNDVLDSKAAKLWGVIGWSEVGFSYFLSNTFLILFIPYLMPYYAIINVCTLPYSLWSVWYQKVKAKVWCPLCLIVQITLWVIFFVNIGFDYLTLPELSLDAIFYIVLIYAVPFIILNLILPLVLAKKEVHKTTQMYNSFKKSDYVFNNLLKEQRFCPVNKETSNILFGSQTSNILITVLTNPHCEPCSRMHSRLEKFLREANQPFCVQYIFSSFSKDLDSSNDFLIWCYFNQKQEQVNEIFRKWFEFGKYERENFFKQYNYEYKNKSNELVKHEEWRQKNGGTCNAYRFC